MSDLLPFDAFRPPKSCEFDISDLVHEVCHDLASEAENHAVHVEIDVPPYQLVTADPGQIRLVLRELIAGAIHATQQHGDVIVTVLEEDGQVEIEVADTRAAVTERQQKALQDDESAIGVSLTLVELARLDQVVQANGGDISVGQCPDGGMAFTVTLQQRHEGGESQDHFRRAA